MSRLRYNESGDTYYGDPCRYCGQDGWPAGSAGNAKAIHEREHERQEAERKRREDKR